MNVEVQLMQYRGR